MVEAISPDQVEIGRFQRVALGEFVKFVGNAEQCGSHDIGEEDVIACRHRGED